MPRIRKNKPEDKNIDTTKIDFSELEKTYSTVSASTMHSLYGGSLANPCMEIPIRGLSPITVAQTDYIEWLLDRIKNNHAYVSDVRSIYSYGGEEITLTFRVRR